MPDQAKTQQQLITALQRNWRTEMAGAANYRELANLVADGHRKSILLKLAEAEERHAERWAMRIRELGGDVPSEAEHRAARDLIATARQRGLEAAFRRIEAEEEQHIDAYRVQATQLDDEPSRRIIEDIVLDEASHARSLQTLAQKTQDPRRRLDRILQQEKWHVSTGNWISDAIYGVNDGLTAVFGIVAGVAGYSGGSNFVVVAGMAGMLASALSMGASGYLANKSEREVLEAELHRERQEIEENPEEEKEELALFYQLKGFSEAEAHAMAERIAEQPEQMLSVLAYEELGLSTERLPDPVRAAVSATLATAVGAIIPVFPFFFTSGTTAIVLSAIVSLLAHFAVGAAKSLVTLRSWWRSGLEMTVVAIVVAVATFLLGSLFAVEA